MNKNVSENQALIENSTIYDVIRRVSISPIREKRKASVDARQRLTG
jgi:hypothetical protein